MSLIYDRKNDAARLNINTSENSKLSWIAAIDSWDYCNPLPLAEMIINHGIPDELRPLIAKIVTGDRKPTKKGAAKLKIDADQRMLIAATSTALLSIGKAVLSKRTGKTYLEVADDRGLEPIEMKRHYESVQNKAMGKCANIAGVSIDSLKKLLLEYQRKLKEYPNL